jgi:hypothetical protein
LSKKLEKFSKKARCKGTRAYPFNLGSPFVPFSEVQEYFTTERVNKLLRAVFLDEMPTLETDIIQTKIKLSFAFF